MSNIKERFDALVQKFGDVELEAASTVLRHFFQQELLALGDEAEKMTDDPKSSGHIQIGFFRATFQAAALIRSKANELN